MKTKIFAMLFLIIGLHAYAQHTHAQHTATLNVSSDLMLHPQEIAGFFDIAAQKIKASDSWSWPALQFEKPYRTSWTSVVARGPFAVQFMTENLSQNEFGFELNWTEPTLNVGQFEIHDSIVINAGGGTFTVRLDGACSNMVLKIPGGNWKVKGKMAWNWSAQRFDVSWSEFTFENNAAATPQIDLGQCNGPQGLQTALLEAIDSISRDQTRMSDILRQGLLEWVGSTLGSLQGALLQARTVPVKDGLSLTWQPSGMSSLAGGMLKVAGQFRVDRTGSSSEVLTVERNYNDDTLAKAHSSGFIFPKDTLAKLVEFLYKTGDLNSRVSSNSIKAFRDLMQSRFIQFFVWPDLMNFAKSSEFFFDLTTEAVPQLANGRMLATGGMIYDVTAPVVVHQWAPTTDKYLPYIDFRSPMQATLKAQIAGDKLLLNVNPSSMKVNTNFRGDFKRLRSVNTRIASSMLGSRVEDYIEDQTYEIPVPSLDLADGFSIRMTDIQAWSQTLRVPLEFKKGN